MYPSETHPSVPVSSFNMEKRIPALKRVLGAFLMIAHLFSLSPAKGIESEDRPLESLETAYLSVRADVNEDDASDTVQNSCLHRVKGGLIGALGALATHLAIAPVIPGEFDFVNSLWGVPVGAILGAAVIDKPGTKPNWRSFGVGVLSGACTSVIHTVNRLYANRTISGDRIVCDNLPGIGTRLTLAGLSTLAAGSGHVLAATCSRALNEGDRVVLIVPAVTIILFTTGAGAWMGEMVVGGNYGALLPAGMGLICSSLAGACAPRLCLPSDDSWKRARCIRNGAPVSKQAGCFMSIMAVGPLVVGIMIFAILMGCCG